MAADTAGLLQEISNTDWSDILAVMVTAAKHGDRRAGEFLLRCRIEAERDLSHDDDCAEGK